MIILMGLAGSGKSTQGQMLAETTGRVWLSAGQVLRDTPDEQVHELQRQGELVPDTITIPLMGQAMTEVFVAGKDAVVDGYPRTVEQAEWIAANVADRIEVVVRIIVPKAELIHRMELRGRADDKSIEAIEERFRIVEQNIYSVCGILRAKGVAVRDIDGTGTPEEVYERLKAVVDEIEGAERMEMTDIEDDNRVAEE